MQRAKRSHINAWRVDQDLEGASRPTSQDEMQMLAETRFHGRCKILYFGVKPLTRRDLSPLLARHFPLSTSVDLSLSLSPHELQVAMKPAGTKISLVEVDKTPAPAFDLIASLVRDYPKVPVIAILPPNQPDTILPSLRVGAVDFLIPPFNGEQVESVARKVIKLLPAPESAGNPAKIYCVMPAKGACGGTTLAWNLAVQWKRLAANRVLLADLDPLTGTLSFLLKIKSQFSFVDVLQREADIDEDLWKAMIVPAQGMDVLLSPETLVEGIGDYTDASPILEFARMHYDVVIADAPSPWGEWNLSQARTSDEILLVSTNELASVRSAQRALEYLEAHGIGRWKIRVILNRYDPRVGLSQDVIANALGVEIQHVLPSDYATVQKSLMEGKPIPPSTALGKSAAQLADRLSGREDISKKSSSLAGLLSLFTRTSS